MKSIFVVRIPIIFLLFFIPFLTYAQPSNDNCAGAITLTSGNTCTSTSSTLQFATSSSPAGTCGGATATTTYDVWFTFQAVNATTTINLNITGSRFSSSSSYTPYIQVLSGTCGSLTSISCQAAATSGVTRVTATGLTVGNFYFIRIYTVTSPAASGAGKWTFNICVQHQPANDECTGAITLTPGATCTNTAGTLDLATANGATPVGCFAAGTYYDVWYKFTATGTTHTVTLSNLGANVSNAQIQLYTGTCGSLTSVATSCGTTTITKTTLTIGTVYYVRIATTFNPTGSTTSSANSFSICVTGAAAPPANDNCTGAFLLSNGITYTGTLLNSTASGETICSTISAGSGEVWYSFVAQSAYPTINLDVTGSNKFPGSSGGSTPAIQLFSGTCGSLTSVTCIVGNDPSLTTTSVNGGAGLTIGATYYFRITSNKVTATTGAGWDFTVSITNPSGTAAVDYGKSYVNITKGTSGGTVDPGDVLEIRATFVVSAGAADSVAYFDTLRNTKGFALVPGSIALKTNDAKIYRYDQLSKVAFTDGAGDDPGWRSPLGSDTAIRINIGKGGTSAARGRVSQSDASPKNNGAVIIMATYQVIVYAGYDTKINFGGGSFSYRDPTTGTLTAINFPTDSLIVYNSPGMCPNALSPTNIVGDEFGGTFGTPSTLSTATRNRGTSANTNYIYAVFGPPTGGGGPNDYYYGIANNTSAVNPPITTTTLAKPDANRVFSVWDITGDHTGSTNTARGNPPCDINQPISATNPCGYMLVINSAYNTDTAFQYLVSNLCTNTYYEISGWFKNICYKCGQDSLGRGYWSGASYLPTGPGDSSGVKPNIAIAIDGVDYYTTGNLQYQGLGGTQTGSDSLNNWVKRGFTFKTGINQTSFVLTFRNNAPGGGGNDWALDDIRMSTCMPNMSYSPSITPMICQGNMLDIYDTVRSHFDNYNFYKWQRSTDGGLSWSDVTSADDTTVTLNGSNYQYTAGYRIPATNTTLADSADLYRLVVATTTSNLSNINCLSTDATNIITLNVQDCGIPLAIDFISFSGKLNHGNADLIWTTSKETEPVSYSIERSYDGTNFSSIGILPGNNNVNATNNTYKYTDLNVKGKVWYRIAMLNKDGHKKYSRIIILEDNTVNFGLTNVVNPFSTKLDFGITVSENSRLDVTLLNMSGKPVRNQTFNVYEGANNLTIVDTEILPVGIYILQIRNNDQIINKKVMKK
jgi:hypothetical protein